MAYKLEPPSYAQVNSVFHVSQLKRKIGLRQTHMHLSLASAEGRWRPKPEKILARPMKKKGSRAVTELLVQWHDMCEEDAVWVDS